MKFLVFSFAILLVAPGYAQSKKELVAEVAKLKAEIEQLKKPTEADISSEQKKVGYSIGVLIGSNVRNSGGDSLDLGAIQAGLRDTWLSRTLKIEREAAGPLVQEYMQKAAEKKRAKAKEENGSWLSVNKSKEGVITTASGLQYKVLKSGTGKTPGSPTTEVVVNYRGTTIDGKEFDGSAKHGGPSTFKLNEVITGWTEALQLMHEGDKWMLYIPAELAWGERGSGEMIPPGATVIFEVELVKVN